MTTCPTCGLDLCINPSFCANCRAADTRKAHSTRWYVYDRTQLDGAPQPTVEALMYSLRERGTKALEETPTKRRLGDLSEHQLHEVCGRLQRLKPHIAPAWASNDIAVLVDIWNGCHA